MIHVLGGEITLTVLVQVPTVQAMRALRTGVALGSLRARVPREAPRTRIACIPFGPRCTLGADVTRVTLGTGKTLNTRVAHRTLRSHRTCRARRPLAILPVLW